MGVQDYAAVIGCVFTALVFIHKMASSPPEENRNFFTWMRPLLLVVAQVLGFYYVFQFLEGGGNPSRAEIFVFVIWMFNIAWSGNALMDVASKRAR